MKIFSLLFLILVITSSTFSLDLEMINLTKVDFIDFSSTMTSYPTKKFNKNSIVMTWRYFHNTKSIMDGLDARSCGISFFKKNERQNITIAMLRIPGKDSLVKKILDIQFKSSSGFFSGYSMLASKSEDPDKVFVSGLFTKSYRFGDRLESFNEKEMLKPYRGQPSQQIKRTPDGKIKNFPSWRLITIYLHGDTGFIVRGTVDALAPNGFDMKKFMDRATVTVNKKRGIAIAFAKLNRSYQKIFEKKGIGKNLKVKLDNYRQYQISGDYKAAKNEIKTFLLELSSFRHTKQLSKSSYSTFKKNSDKIVKLLNQLLS